MNTQELCDAVLNNGFNATAELYDSDPAAAIGFINATRKLRKIIQDVRETYPDAQYYLNDDQFHLMLGDSHTHTRDFGVANGEANRTLVAVTSLELIGLIGGGGW